MTTEQSLEKISINSLEDLTTPSRDINKLNIYDIFLF